MLHDVLHVDRLGHPVRLVEVAEVGRQVRIFRDALPAVLVEVGYLGGDFWQGCGDSVIDLIEPHQRREQTDVRLGQTVARQIAPFAQ